MKFPVLILSLAIVQVIVSLLCRRFAKPTISKCTDETLFVLLVAYRTKWVNNLISMMQRAHNPRRIFVGVIEYIVNPKCSESHKIPSHLRHAVRTMTMTAEKYSLDEARDLGMKELYMDEDFILKTTCCLQTSGWDEALIQDAQYTNGILTAQLLSDKRKFPSVQQGKLVYKDFVMQGYKKPSQVIAPSSHLVCHAAEHTDTYWCPRITLQCTDFQVPVTSDKTIIEETAHAHCGLTSNPSSHEMIAKYGSSWQAKYALQRVSKI